MSDGLVLNIWSNWEGFCEHKKYNFVQASNILYCISFIKPLYLQGETNCGGLRRQEPCFNFSECIFRELQKTCRYKSGQTHNLHGLPGENGSFLHEVEVRTPPYRRSQTRLGPALEFGRYPLSQHGPWFSTGHGFREEGRWEDNFYSYQFTEL